MRLPFGPKGAITYFQTQGERTILGIKDVIFYLDNFLVASQTFKSHCESVRRVIEALTEAGFWINRKKCKFLMKKLKFMGHLIDGNSCSIDSHKMKVAAKIAHPVTGKQVEQMLGFFNFLRNFIPNFASIAVSLEKLRKLRKITSTWGEAEEKVFQDLKYVVEHVLVLSQPDWELEFQVACDASQDAVGVVLYQVTEDGSKKYFFFFLRQTLFN